MGEAPRKRIMVTGGRDFDDRELIYHTLVVYDVDPKPVLLHGACKTGADKWCAAIAHDLGWRVVPYPADWSKGRRDGPARNRAMARSIPKPDLCIAFPGNDGTQNAVDEARDAHILIVHVCEDGVREEPPPPTLF